MTTRRFAATAALVSLILFALQCKAAAVTLPKPALEGQVSVEEALAKRRSIRSYAPSPLTLLQVSQLLWAAQGITDPGGKRTAPSAGARYPLELYLVAGNVDKLAPGIYRYSPKGNELTAVAKGDQRARLVELAGMQGFIKDAPIMVIICADYAAMNRYGERGRAFVDFEIGHVGQNISLEAVAMGLGTVAIGAFDVAKLGSTLGLPKALSAVYLFPIGAPK